MSNQQQELVQECSERSGCDAIEHILLPHVKDLGGFSVRRLLPTVQRKMVGPWIFFDHMGPAEFAAGSGINVRPHPHINIATVTYLFEGEILHRDSLGSEQVIQPGDINLMVTGKGMTHSERERPELSARAHRLHGLQLWLALPEADEECEPEFLHYPQRSIPTVGVNDVALRVMIGSAFGVQSPVKAFAETLYLEASLKQGQRFHLPALAAERAVYVASGSLRAHSSNIETYAMAVLKEGAEIELEAITDARIAVIGGENLGRRFMEWNFVSSRKQRIEQAKQDWSNGRFPKVLGDEHEFIPYP